MNGTLSNAEYQKARYERSLKIIDSFAPKAEPEQIEIKRTNCINYIKGGIEKIHKATDKELLEMVAIIEALSRR